MDTSGIQTQFPYVLILALVTTAIGHSMFIHSLKNFTASTVSILSGAQPIFGIIIAYLFLSEIPSPNTFLGGAIIISTVIVESIRAKKK
jgi:drug/metabolite transporter (DMT)-like permease